MSIKITKTITIGNASSKSDDVEIEGSIEDNALKSFIVKRYCFGTYSNIYFSNEQIDILINRLTEFKKEVQVESKK